MTAIQQEPETLVRVPSADDMDRETFFAHIAKRHEDSLGGQSSISTLHMSEYVEECWRVFHDKLHDDPTLFPTGPFDHYHKEPQDG